MNRTPQLRVSKNVSLRLTHIILLGLVLGALLMATPAAAVQERARLSFDVFRDGSRSGSHSISFLRESPESMAVEIDINLEVKFGPFTVFNYSHCNTTEWKNGRLWRMQSVTDDNGDYHEVNAKNMGELLQVSASGIETYSIGPNILPTTYWMASTVMQSELINSQTGERIDIKVREVGREDISAPGGLVPAKRYKMTGDLEIDLWYDDNGILAGLAFRARGSDVTYRLTERTDELLVAASMSNLIARHSGRF